MSLSFPFTLLLASGNFPGFCQQELKFKPESEFYKARPLVLARVGSSVCAATTDFTAIVNEDEHS